LLVEFTKLHIFILIEISHATPPRELLSFRLKGRI